MPLLSSQLLPQLRPALRTELVGAVGLGATVGAELTSEVSACSRRTHMIVHADDILSNLQSFVVEL